MAGRCLPAILLILAAAAPPVLAETYKWVDAKGVVNYSNTPPPQAAKRQVVEERISVVAPDPSLGPAIAAMRARTARQAEFEEADWARRQGYMLMARTSYPGSNCAYGADCGVSYAAPAYYPYFYGGRVFGAGAAPRFAPLAMQRAFLPGGGSVVLHRASFPAGGGRVATHSGRGSLR